MDLSIWFVIIAAGAITYLIRLSFIFLQDRLILPDWFSRGLRYVPPAVLSAITLPELANWNGQVNNITWLNPQLLAGFVAILVAWRTRNVVLTLVIGLVSYFVLLAWI